MKKILALLLLSLTLMTACADSDLTAEQKAEYRAMLKDNQEIIENQDDYEYVEVTTAIKETAVAYQRLGNINKALDYYEEVLERHPSNYTTLNNLVAYYHNTEQWEEAKAYGITFFEYYGRDEVVAERVIRIHAEAGDFDEAQYLLEFFAANFQDESNISFISETYEYIARMKGKLLLDESTE